MCGIAGILSLSEDQRVDESSLTAMREAMVHRGPNSGANHVCENQRVGLAHRRLSIIDLSELAIQPMEDLTSSAVLTFNGEIYNHVMLRAELKHLGFGFRTDHSDTEVILNGFLAWGFQGILQKLEGDFAFAIWDKKRKTIYLARDRAGVKPLYFSFTDANFLFGSEIKAILKHPDIKPQMDDVAMYHYLSFMTTPAPLTMFVGIYKLPAGCCMEVQINGDVSFERYWEALPGQSGLDPKIFDLPIQKREEVFVREIRQRLTASVEKRMMSDVPFGVFLSGGVDSSTNVALMDRYTDQPVNTFSVGFKDFKHLNEFDYAQQIAKQFNTNHHEIHIDENDMRGYLGQLIHSQDEPIADWVCVPLYFVTKLTKDNGVTVVQVGEGADEQFCGYKNYMMHLDMYDKYWTPFRKYLPLFAQKMMSSLADRLTSSRPDLDMYADIIHRAANDREHFWTGATIYWERIKRRLLNFDKIKSVDFKLRGNFQKILNPDYHKLDSFNIIKDFRSRILDKYPKSDILTRMIFAEFQLRLPELLLMRVDKITMSESIEARVPFLDHKLIELSMDIPRHDKIQKNEPKYLLKKAVEGIIPDNIIYRQKMGFGAPMADWLRGEFGEQIHEEMRNSTIMDKGIFKQEYIDEIFHLHRNCGKEFSAQIWILYNLFAWYDYWIAKAA